MLKMRSILYFEVISTLTKQKICYCLVTMHGIPALEWAGNSSKRHFYAIFDLNFIFDITKLLICKTYVIHSFIVVVFYHCPKI